MSHNKLLAMFEAAEDEYIEFERIPVAERRHSRPDVCAFIFLDEKQPQDRDMICASEHDEFYLDIDTDEIELTQEDVVYLTRCGVRYDGSSGGFAMFS